MNRACRRAIGALRLARKSSIAAGLRRNARDASRPLALLGLTKRTSRDYAEILSQLRAVPLECRTVSIACS
jgi:hypothetical protein